MAHEFFINLLTKLEASGFGRLKQDIFNGQMQTFYFNITTKCILPMERKAVPFTNIELVVTEQKNGKESCTHGYVFYLLNIELIEVKYKGIK